MTEIYAITNHWQNCCISHGKHMHCTITDGVVMDMSYLNDHRQTGIDSSICATNQKLLAQLAKCGPAQETTPACLITYYCNVLTIVACILLLTLEQNTLDSVQTYLLSRNTRDVTFLRMARNEIAMLLLNEDNSQKTSILLYLCKGAGANYRV